MRALLCCLFTMVMASRAVAQPDFAKASELYDRASKAMAEGRHADAARDFLGAYDITKDPVLFFKIASAYDKAGTCGEATTYYKRYLGEAKPEPKFVELTNQRLAACAATKPDVPDRVGPAADTGSSPPAPAAAPPRERPSRSKNGAWLLVGGSLAFVTAGAVLAYAASSSQQDLKDLYVSDNGMPPVFDSATQKTYDELVDEGNRYKYLSWGSFGIAGGCAIGALILFLRGGGSDEARLSLAPVVTPRTTGMAATLRF